jgi:hypothetical protein
MRYFILILQSRNYSELIWKHFFCECHFIWSVTSKSSKNNWKFYFFSNNLGVSFTKLSEKDFVAEKIQFCRLNHIKYFKTNSFLTNRIHATDLLLLSIESLYTIDFFQNKGRNKDRKLVNEVMKNKCLKRYNLKLQKNTF